MGPVGPLWEIDPVEWWTTMDVNVRGIVLCSQLVLPDMVAANRGRIINITSQAGVHRWPLVSAYSVSKAAVVKLTENLALETSRHGVGVFSVHPGLLPIGISETFAAHTPTTSHEARIRRWALNELAEGRGADPRAPSSCCCGSPPAMATSSRAGTSRCTTISTPSWPTCRRSRDRDSTCSGPSAC